MNDFEDVGQFLVLTQLAGNGPIGSPRVTAGDDFGTHYEASPITGGGHTYQSRHQFSLTPKIPPGARRLTIEINELFEPDEGRARAGGPWILVLDLGSSA